MKYFSEGNKTKTCQMSSPKELYAAVNMHERYQFSELELKEEKRSCISYRPTGTPGI